jgi:hypothetical protein
MAAPEVAALAQETSGRAIVSQSGHRAAPRPRRALPCAKHSQLCGLAQRTHRAPACRTRAADEMRRWIDQGGSHEVGQSVPKGTIFGLLLTGAADRKPSGPCVRRTSVVAVECRNG